MKQSNEKLAGQMSDKELECLRKKAYIQYKITFLLCGSLCLASILLIGRSGIGNNDYTFLEWGLFTLFITGLMTVTAYCACYFLLIRRAYQVFNKAYKERYVLSLISRTGRFHDLEYHPKDGFTFDELSNMAVVNCGAKNHFTSKDMLTGSYRNVRFRFCDVTTGRLVKAGKVSHVETIFQGQIIRFDDVPALRGSNGRLQIFENEFLARFSGRTAAHRLKTMDSEFNNRFQVYASDAHNAFLTPLQIEKNICLCGCVRQADCDYFTGVHNADCRLSGAKPV